MLFSFDMCSISYNYTTIFTSLCSNIFTTSVNIREEKGREAGRKRARAIAVSWGVL